MVSNGIMNTQINLRLPEKMLVSAQTYVEKHGCNTVQDFIKELMREKLFEEPKISKEELTLVKKLIEASEKKNLYGTEAELFSKLRRQKMEYELKPSHFFLQQAEELSDEAARIVENKLKLLKINPFRNKRIEGQGLFLFRIRFEDSKREKRIIYLVDKPYIKLICILDRKDDYKDLKKYLKSLDYL